MNASSVPGTVPDGGSRRLAAIVAIPVRDEEERIGACLAALGAQAGIAPDGYGLVLFLNNCRDGTEAAVAALLPSLRCPVRVIVRDHAAAHAGWARREAMEAAAAWLEAAGRPGALLMTTDADSRVPVDWITRNIAAAKDGAEVVAGRFELDAAEAARLPPRLHARGRLEGEYEGMLNELEARLSPDPWDPWPRHRVESGATLAVTLPAYRAAGGIPAVPVGEDRAFVAAVRSVGGRVRHDPGIVVVTSGRLDGRAPGGAADTMRLRCAEPDAPCDAALRPLLTVLVETLAGRAPAARPLLPRDLPRQIRLARLVLMGLRLFDRRPRRRVPAVPVASPLRQGG